MHTHIHVYIYIYTHICIYIYMYIPHVFAGFRKRKRGEDELYTRAREMIASQSWAVIGSCVKGYTRRRCGTRIRSREKTVFYWLDADRD